MTLLFSKKVFHIFLLAFLMFQGILKAEGQNSTLGTTISDGKIYWNYYIGQVDNTSKFWAMTYWNVSYKYLIFPYRGDTVKVDLQTWTVLKNTSWVLQDKQSDELLQHEQGHFNFAIVSELEFKKAVTSTTLFKSDYSKKIDSIFNSTLYKYKQLEIEYDNETNHMLNKKNQIQWNKKFELLLQQ